MSFNFYFAVQTPSPNVQSVPMGNDLLDLLGGPSPISNQVNGGTGKVNPNLKSLLFTEDTQKCPYFYYFIPNEKISYKLHVNLLGPL